MLSKITKLTVIFILILSVTFLSMPKTYTQAAPTFAKGADVSWLPEMEANGYKFYNDDGIEQDCLQILKDHGIDSIRLRVWVNPPNGYCNKEETIKMALRAKKMGFRIMINFHYSDSWADPGKQTKPAAWAKYDFNGLMKAVYDYTYDVMSALKANGITPEWVQVGNETNNGMLWEDGKATNSMRNFAWLINGGYEAVKAVSPETKVIVHIANGYDNALYRWIFDGITANGARFDVIGMSLYPTASDWPQLTNQCLNNMKDMISRYGKEIMICEIGMDYWEAQACKDFITDIIQKTKSLPDNKGLGVFYWEPQCYNWQYYNKGAFDLSGKPTIALDAFLTSDTPDNLIYGDLNGDGRVNSTDYTLLKRYLLGAIQTFPYERGIKAADLNLDGRINSTDYTVLKRYLLNAIPSLPVK